MFLRTGLTAIALVIVAFPAVVIFGGFAPGLPWVARFGAFIVEALPWVMFGAVVAAIVAALAVRLGGRWPARIVLGITVATFVGSIAIGIDLASFAAGHDAEFDLVRQATTPEAARAPAAPRCEHTRT